jgi:hypothetical protein
MNHKNITLSHLSITIICALMSIMCKVNAQPISAACLPPDSVYSDSITSTSAVLSWTPVSGALVYNVAYKPYGTTQWSNWTVTEPTVKITDLQNSTKYVWKVYAHCFDTISQYTPNAFFTTLPKCVAPTGLTKDNITLNSVHLSWNAVVGAKGYFLGYKPDDQVNWIYVHVTGTTIKLTNLKPSTKYVWIIATRCYDGPSGYSANAYFTTADPCSAPRDLVHGVLTSTSAVIRWDTVGDANSYFVAYKPTDAPTWLYKKVYGTRTTLTDLIPSTEYVWIVGSSCGYTSSGYSPNSYFTTLPPCTAPGTLSKSVITLNSVKLSWSDVIGARSYNVAYRQNAADAAWSVTPVTGTSIQLTGLMPKTQYVWKVSTTCGDGTSNYSANTYFTTADSCSVPRNPRSSNVTSSSAYVRWDPVGDADSFAVAYKPSATIGGWKYKRVSAGTVTKLTELNPLTEYVWIVLSYCGDKVSGYSVNAYFTTQSMTTAAAEPEEVVSTEAKSVEMYPNPLKQGRDLSVSYAIPETGIVKISLVDANGITRLKHESTQQAAGIYKMVFENVQLTTGFYILHIQAGKTPVRRHHLVIQP